MRVLCWRGVVSCFTRHTGLRDYGAHCVLYTECLLDYYAGRSYPGPAFAACSASNTGKEAQVSFAAPVNEKKMFAKAWVRD